MGGGLKVICTEVQMPYGFCVHVNQKPLMLSNLWIPTQFHLPKLQLHLVDGQTRHLKPPPSPSDGQNVTSHPTATVSLCEALSHKCEELEHVTGFRVFSGNKVSPIMSHSESCKAETPE